MNSRRKFLKTIYVLSPVLAFPKSIFGESTKEFPKVMLIGDSIAGGYFPTVQKLLKGKAIITMPLKDDGTSDSCEGTTKGVANIDDWLGDTKWDVIHFNFGLHDIKHIKPGTSKNSKNPNDPHQANPKQYGENLQEIVRKMKNTGAKLIFATTTPYPDTAIKPFRLPGMPERYNKVATNIMTENSVTINDLYTMVLPRMNELQISDNVHFTEAGYKVIGECVADKILEFI